MCGDTACTSHTESGETFGEDEGFDQGGLRKAWIELSATHFVRSDLSVHAEEEASHLDSERRLQAEGHSLKSLPLSSSDRQCLYSIIFANMGIIMVMVVMSTNDAASMLFHVSSGRDRTAPRFVGWLSERMHASTNTVPVGQRSLLFAATKNGGTRCA